ncbi:MAG: hypothetical protein JWP62_3356, partial [Blastococcus sp.]|nr:hypothetical protein [Blastococcus sp.]
VLAPGGAGDLDVVQTGEHARISVQDGRVATANTRRKGSSVVPSGRAG